MVESSVSFSYLALECELSCKLHREGLPERQDMTEGTVLTSLGERWKSMVNIHTPLMSVTWMSLLHVQFDTVPRATATINNNHPTFSLKGLLFILRVWLTYPPSSWSALPPPEERNPSTMSTTSRVSLRRSGVRSS